MRLQLVQPICFLLFLSVIETSRVVSFQTQIDLISFPEHDIMTYASSNAENDIDPFTLSPSAHLFRAVSSFMTCNEGDSHSLKQTETITPVSL